ncbi:pilus assembly protein [Colwellia psychrerythraea]|uniref:Neisseria PilC domain protein n=1 Tax=Colwellia psychrerythraea TaxID=28229 RepID=A0A099KQA3_COLPS|nr:PilC/PilY family type IV pilus protein [Colwellia psychrerythraea]KGJ91848.1 Neisseria PilC domain protein [Colwellia psychrerythraea]
MNLSKERNTVTKVVKRRYKTFVSCITTVSLLLVSTSGFSEDIELYISDTIKKTENRPKVLIIFDNSGSMSNNGDYFKKKYDPSFTYDALPGLSKKSGKRIYFSKGDSSVSSVPIPDSPTETRLFLKKLNGCQIARDSLDKYGLYTGRVREYTFQGNSGSWTEIPEKTGENIKVIDCEDDVDALNANNKKMINSVGSAQSIPDGFPIDGEGSQAAPQPHTPNATNSNVTWSGQFVTLYTDNYLRWSQSTKEVIGTKYKSRLEVAKESVTSLINSTPNVDFGLQVFNGNSGSDNDNGGRIVHGIQESTLDSRTKLLGIIDNLLGNTWTPLCETLYEATQYFGAKPVYYGDDDDFVPKRDPDIEKSGSYISPFSACSDRVYVVLITDGSPTYDIDADDEIFKLPATGQDPFLVSDNFFVNGYKEYDAEWSYLAALAGWINNNDLNLNLDGKQTAETYTIGFGEDAKKDAAPLLIETAKRGGGEYFYAEDSASLTTALTNVLANLEPSNDSLTSASVAANNFDKTETLDAVYYAMFQPDRGPRWQGNLKKYKVSDSIQKGINGVAAINEATGHFSDDAQSYWSSTKDGNSVQEGGVAEMLRNKSNRIILSDLGENNALVGLTYAEASSSEVFETQSELATALDVADDKVAIEASLNWINGKDEDDADEDGDKNENREDVFGDPLHSKPVVINYGNDNIYIAVGTNHGVLHMFKDIDSTNTIEETWAFMPKDFISNIKALRENFTSADKVYGVDGLITAHITDKNGNGIVDSDDKVWLFYGFRRGGNTYYAMDVTDPTNPSVMWIIKGGDLNFEELGQTWSQPKIAYSLLNVVGGKAKPVLIFGGGYDISKDSHGIGGVNGEDNLGKAIYMLDAETGTLLWSLSPTGDTIFTGTDSIPSSIATLDSDGDGLTDRLYAGDTGGNVWRIDMPGSDTSKFSVFKLASLGNANYALSDKTLARDRRFFNEPAIVRAFITETIDSGQRDSDNNPIIVQQDIPYDAVLLGSGDRANPIGTDTNDVFFMIKDINIKTQQFIGVGTPTIPAIPTPITINNLADYTNNPFGASLTSQEKETLSLQVSLMSGWYMDLEEKGEKSTSSALVINNVVNFTTFIPAPLGVNSLSCDLPNGQGWLYAVDLALGVHKYNWQTEDPDSDDNRKTLISEQFLGSPTLIVTKTLNPETNILEPDGNIIVGREIIPVGFQLQTLRTYLYVTEN